MAGTIWEFFGYAATDQSAAALNTAQSGTCPYISAPCEKRFRDGNRTGVCTLKPITTEPVICCPIRLYAEDYKILRNVADHAFRPGLELVAGKQALEWVQRTGQSCVAVFGKGRGGELRLPQKDGRGGYFVDWVLTLLDENGELEEFVAVEVQTIDTTGNYSNGYQALMLDRSIVKTTAGLNWENVSKRILPQLIYKGQVLQREELCRKGLFFVCPTPVYNRIMARLGGQQGLIKYALQPASITFMTYIHDTNGPTWPGETIPLQQDLIHSTTVYKVQEAFNNVTLPDENVYKEAILKALGKPRK